MTTIVQQVNRMRTRIFHIHFVHLHKSIMFRVGNPFRQFIRLTHIVQSKFHCLLPHYHDLNSSKSVLFTRTCNRFSYFSNSSNLFTRANDTDGFIPGATIAVSNSFPYFSHKQSLLQFLSARFWGYPFADVIKSHVGKADFFSLLYIPYGIPNPHLSKRKRQ